MTLSPLRVAALVDLPRSDHAGGHVKCWERFATAAAQSDLPLDLTVYFTGDAPDEVLAPHVRLRHLRPVFSTARLKFLPYVPDHTDLASRHPRLERELKHYDVIHTTDGIFAFTQTAERVSKRLGVPLVTSFHTDTPSYTRIFTQQTIETIFGKWPRVRHKLIEDWKIPERQQQSMQRKLERHVRSCRYALVTRAEDHRLAETLIGKEHVGHLRLGIDREMFGTHRQDRTGVLDDYAIPEDRILALFVGRIDAGKNIETLTEAIEILLAKNAPIHLIVAGIGPFADDVRRRLGDHVSLPGFVEPSELARLYASVDLCVVPSEVEMRSMACVEAMACGCPTMISSKSGIFDLFDQTPAMQVIDSGAENWATALRDFMNSKNRQSAMRKAAIDYGQHHLASWRDVLAEDLFAYWDKAFKERQRQAA